MDPVAANDDVAAHSQLLDADICMKVVLEKEMLPYDSHDGESGADEEIQVTRILGSEGIDMTDYSAFLHHVLMFLKHCARINSL